MSPPLPSLSTVNRTSDDKTTASRSPPYPSPPNEEHDPIEKHQSTTRSHPAPRSSSPRPSSPKQRVEPASTTKAQPQPAAAAKSASSAEPVPEAAPQQEDEVDDEDDDEEPNTKGVIDMEIFGQLLDLDDDEPEFSKGMVDAYFIQAKATFRDLDEAFGRKDLPKLSSLGHYLKGSSAALGISHVEQHCERIQHYGALRDEEADKALTPSEALALIGKTLVRVKKENRVAEKWLKEYYKEEPQS